MKYHQTEIYKYSNEQQWGLRGGGFGWRNKSLYVLWVVVESKGLSIEVE